MPKLHKSVIIACVFIIVCSFVGMTVNTTERFVNLNVSIMGPNADFREGYNNVTPQTKENINQYTQAVLSEILDHFMAALIKWISDPTRSKLPFDMTWYVPKTMNSVSLKEWKKRLYVQKLAEFGLEEEGFPWQVISKYLLFFENFKGTVANFQTNSIPTSSTEHKIIDEITTAMLNYFKKYKTMPVGKIRYNATLNVAANIDLNTSMDMSKYNK